MESSLNLFLVVEFPNEAVGGKAPCAIISSQWLAEDDDGNGNCAYWPGYFKKDAQRMRATEQHSSINKSKSDLCQINILYKTEYYNRAILKMKKFEKSGIVSESDVDGKRKIRKRTISEDTSSSSASSLEPSSGEDDEESLTAPPLSKKQTVLHKKKSNSIASSVLALTKNNTSKLDDDIGEGTDGQCSKNPTTPNRVTGTSKRNSFVSGETYMNMNETAKPAKQAKIRCNGKNDLNSTIPTLTPTMPVGRSSNSNIDGAPIRSNFSTPRRDYSSLVEDTIIPAFNSTANQEHSLSANMLSDMSNRLVKLEMMVKNQTLILNQLQQNADYLIRIQSRNNNEETFDSLEIKQATTKEELEALNNDLEDKDITTNYCKSLQQVGGKDAQDNTRRVLCKLMSNGLANMYNWSGQNNKAQFCVFKNIIKLIFVVVRKNPLAKNATECEVWGEIKKWLRYSGDRDGGRARRNRR